MKKREKWWRIHTQTKETIGAGKLKEKWGNPEKKNCNLCKKKKFFVVAYII
jgi:hypothetical protein